MKAIWENIVQPLCLAVAAVFGIWSTISSRDAAESADDAKTAAISAETAATTAKVDLDKRAADRADLGGDRDYQIKITEMVIQALKDGNAGAQRAAFGIVSTLPNRDLQLNLAAALGSSSDRQVAGSAQFISQNIADGRPALGAASPGQPGASDAKSRTIASNAPAIGATRELTPLSKNGWDFDIFWCQGGTDLPRLAAANNLANSLADLSRSGGQLGGQRVGRVRVRPLPEAINQRAGYQINANVVRADSLPGEPDVAAALAQIGILKVEPSAQATRWYISAFYCA